MRAKAHIASMFVPRLLPVAVLAVFTLTVLVLPVARMRVRQGTTGIVVHRAPSTLHRLVSTALGGYAGGLGLWSVLYLRLGPAPLGVLPAPSAVHALGIALLAGSIGLAMVAQRQMGASWRIGIDAEPTALVTRGLYGVVRNPIYTALLAGFAGVALLTPSCWTWLGAAQAMFVVALQARLEEEHMARMHGEAFRTYAARVGRFWPGIGRLADR
jgi:protein-S-isoprenylcysteine O-methyltransferase Ste14